jgi:hypothetical protein
MLSTKEYARLAIQVVATDRTLAKAIVSASSKLRPPRHELVLFEAALRDAIAETTVPPEAESAARMLRQAGERPSETDMRLSDEKPAKKARGRNRTS